VANSNFVTEISDGLVVGILLCVLGFIGFIPFFGYKKIFSDAPHDHTIQTESNTTLFISQ